MEFYREVSFINNIVDGSVGGAVYLISSSEMILQFGTHLKFINNTGRYVQGKLNEFMILYYADQVQQL